MAGKTTKKAAAKKMTRPTLLAGGNPQIAKADGDAPVQAYIAAMPGAARLGAVTCRGRRLRQLGGTLPSLNQISGRPNRARDHEVISPQATKETTSAAKRERPNAHLRLAAD